jgi:hypothetical protein
MPHTRACAMREHVHQPGIGRPVEQRRDPTLSGKIDGQLCDMAGHRELLTTLQPPNGTGEIRRHR